MPTAAEILTDWQAALVEAPDSVTVAYGSASATGRYLRRGNELDTEATGQGPGETSVVTVPYATFADALPPLGSRITVAGTERRLLSRRIRAGTLLDLTYTDVLS